jgi:ABC-type glucose/galactose transport system permease subunit
MVAEFIAFTLDGSASSIVGSISIAGTAGNFFTAFERVIFADDFSGASTGMDKYYRYFIDIITVANTSEVASLLWLHKLVRERFGWVQICPVVLRVNTRIYCLG